MWIDLLEKPWHENIRQTLKSKCHKMQLIFPVKFLWSVEMIWLEVYCITTLHVKVPLEAKSVLVCNTVTLVSFLFDEFYVPKFHFSSVLSFKVSLIMWNIPGGMKMSRRCIIGVCRTPMWSTRPVFRSRQFAHNESYWVAINAEKRRNIETLCLQTPVISDWPYIFIKCCWCFFDKNDQKRF